MKLQKKPVPRLKQHIEQYGEMPEMPPVSSQYADHLLSRFFEILPSVEGEQGMSPLSFTEIDSWLNLTHGTLSPGEAVMIRDLSRDYVSQYSLSSDVACPAPWSPVILDGESRESVQVGTKRLFAQLREQKHKQQRGR